MTLPLVTVGIAFLLIDLSKIPLGVGMQRMPGGYDNRHPRAQQAKLEGWASRATAAPAAHQSEVIPSHTRLSLAIRFNHGRKSTS
jgi:uncharacterized MAPEG superfamily protein